MQEKPRKKQNDPSAGDHGWGRFACHAGGLPPGKSGAGSRATGTMTCSANNYLKGMIENDPDVTLYPALAKFAASAKAAFAD